MTTDESSQGEVRFTAARGNAAVPDWYPELLDTVAGRIQTGRQRAIAAANSELLGTYWTVGNDILARQGAEGWGARVIDRLSADLRERFPDARGFSARNLKYMRAFAAAWPDVEIVQAPLAQLPWYHHIALLEKLGSTDLRLWYAQTAIEEGWSRNVLVHHIDERLHERAGKAISGTPATTRRSVCCCAKRRATWSPSTPCAVSPHPSASPSGRPRSPRVCPQNSNPACRASSCSKLSYPRSPMIAFNDADAHRSPGLSTADVSRCPRYALDGASSCGSRLEKPPPSAHSPREVRLASYDEH